MTIYYTEKSKFTGVCLWTKAARFFLFKNPIRDHRDNNTNCSSGLRNTKEACLSKFQILIYVFWKFIFSDSELEFRSIRI